MRLKPDFFAYNGDKEKLKKFLKSQRFNTHSQFGVDKNDNRLIKLYWDSKPNSDWGKLELRAIICMVGTGKMEGEAIAQVATEIKDVINKVSA